MWGRNLDCLEGGVQHEDGDRRGKKEPVPVARDRVYVEKAVSGIRLRVSGLEPNV